MSKKTGSRQQETFWSRRLLDPIGDWLTDRAISRNEAKLRKTQQHLHNINPDSYLVLLNKILRQLLDGIQDVDSIFKSHAMADRSGKRVWNTDSFARFLQVRIPQNTAVSASIPILWRAFCTAACFPFSQQSNDLETDMNGFKRAFAFIVTRGYELLGAMSDGSTSDWREGRKSYADKVPRLARIVFGSLSIPWLQSGTQSRISYQSLQLQNIRDTIAFIQPIMTEDFSIETPKVADEEWEAATQRVLLADNQHSKLSGLPMIVKKDNLQTVLQLFFLQRVEDKRWRAGLDFHSSQRSGDIMYSHCSADPEEILRASRLASTFMAYQFSDAEDYVTWEQFKVCCTERPYFIFAFFQLWATLFTSTTTMQAPRVGGDLILPISTTNILSFLNVAHMVSGFRSNDRYHANELGLQLDLQAATLVANFASTPQLKAEGLHDIIMQRNKFHMVLIWGEDLYAEGKSSSRLIIAFTSPPEEEMWRRIEGKRFVQYVWQASVVQLEPYIAVANSGGTSASVEGHALELRPHKMSGEKGTSIRVDLAERVVYIDGLAIGHPVDAKNQTAVSSLEAKSTSVIRLMGLKCYRMPGFSAKVTTSGGEKRFWQ